MTPQHEESLHLLRLARRDAAAFKALLTVRGIDFPIACFHAQQAVEKAIKGVMHRENIEFRRTHDLEELAALLAGVGVAVPVSLDCLRRLTPYAVEFRYDDEAVDLLSEAEAEDAVERTLAWATDILGGANT